MGQVRKVVRGNKSNNSDRVEVKSRATWGFF